MRVVRIITCVAMKKVTVRFASGGIRLQTQGTRRGKGKEADKLPNDEETEEVEVETPSLVLHSFSLIRVRIEMADTRPLSVRIVPVPRASQPTRNELSQFDSTALPPVDK
jgi:hypothetical protein